MQPTINWDNEEFWTTIGLRADRFKAGARLVVEYLVGKEAEAIVSATPIGYAPLGSLYRSALTATQTRGEDDLPAGAFVTVEIQAHKSTVAVFFRLKGPLDEGLLKEPVELPYHAEPISWSPPEVLRPSEMPHRPQLATRPSVNDRGAGDGEEYAVRSHRDGNGLRTKGRADHDAEVRSASGSRYPWVETLFITKKAFMLAFFYDRFHDGTNGVFAEKGRVLREFQRYFPNYAGDPETMLSNILTDGSIDALNRSTSWVEYRLAKQGIYYLGNYMDLAEFDRNRPRVPILHRL